MNFYKSIVLALVLATPSAVMAHGNEDHAKMAGPVKKEQKDWGIAGDAKAVKRTIAISMSDSMRFPEASRSEPAAASTRSWPAPSATTITA